MTEHKSDAVLTVSDLTVVTAAGIPIIRNVSFELAAGQVLGIVGESGSGKTTAALALLGFARDGAYIASGAVEVAGHAVADASERELRSLRGCVVSYVPQDPSNSLNPGLRIKDQLRLILKAHRPDLDVAQRTQAVLKQVDLPTTRDFIRRYPHQLSGGQQQRVSIALALACEPALVVLDEPTTGLDVITQANILSEIARLKRSTGTAFVYVSHDLAAVASIADRVAVCYAGEVVEESETGKLFEQPQHPYTVGLINAVPDEAHPRRLVGIPGHAAGLTDRPGGCTFAPRCSYAVAQCEAEAPSLVDLTGAGHWVRCVRPGVASVSLAASRASVARSSDALLSVQELSCSYPSPHGLVQVVDDVSFDVSRGEVLALVGQSGSGKTTIARAVIGLHAPDSGTIQFEGTPLAATARARRKDQRRDIQMVFQNPYSSLNPRRTAGASVVDAGRTLRKLSRAAAKTEAAELFELVCLPQTAMAALPAQLSGGERQRVAIARALIAKPRILVCDEVTSALDASVQASVTELLLELRDKLNLSLLFVTHDLGLVASVADRVLVLEHGQVREAGTVRDVLASPSTDYTRRLVSASPSLPRRADDSNSSTGRHETPTAV